VKQPQVGAAGLALAAVLALCVLAPPDVRGAGLAAVALFVAVAVVATGGTAAASPASRLIFAAVPLALFASRTAVAPGEAVEPAACLFLAAFAGTAATASAFEVERLAWLYGLLVSVAGGRALYEAGWGLAAWAERVRATAPAAGAAAVLNRIEQGRPYAGFMTPAALGCLLAMTIPAIAAWALGKRGRPRLAGFAAVAIGAGGLVASRSVSAMVALCGAIALAALRGRVTPRLVAIAVPAIGIAVVVIGLLRPDAVFAPGREDSPWRLRAGNVRIGLEIARDHPLAGAGPGGYAETFSQYRRPGDNESRHAHALPAELMAEWGVPVGLALSALFFWLFLSPVLRTTGDRDTLTSGLAIGLAAFALHNVVDFTAFLPSLLILAAVTRGLIAATPSLTPATLPLRAAWVGLALAIALLCALSGFARDALFDAGALAAEGDHAAVLALAQRAERLAPWDADPPMLAAEARLAAAPPDPAAAAPDAERAVALAPSRASARWLRARVRSAGGDATGAYADTVEAARLYPMRKEYAAQATALAGALRQASAAAPR
jgi:hypothetical protein